MLYPVDVDAAIDMQLRHWEQRSVAYDIEQLRPIRMEKSDINDLGISHFTQIKRNQSDFDTLVLLGIGSGQYIIRLMQKFRLRFVLLYEPNWQLLFASLSICDWREIFEYCELHKITIFLQTTVDFQSDLRELSTSTDAKSALIFQHLHTGDFDAFIRQNRFDTQELTEHEYQCAEMEIWQPTADLRDWELFSPFNDIYNNNVRALREHYPQIADVFSSYDPKLWLPVKHRHSNQISLFNRYSHTIYSPHPNEDATREFNVFCRYPNREQLFMGYLGNKLNHFAFNHFYTEIGAVLSSQEQTRAELPESLELLIIFGLGNGYHLDSFYNEKKLKNVFFVEPNPDFFFWSLLVADWTNLFKTIIDNDGKMYLSIGQLDKGLTGELTRQYAYIGNHHVAKTWIFQGYRTPSINLYLNEVRNTFKTLFSISDNFNHCFYGLEHFLFSVEHKFEFMTQQVKSASRAYGHIPVFMVGNGPSVDDCIEQLRAYKDKVIIVSCGTTLKTLYNYGIVPDYHAEVEAYRANYDWITQIPDKDYLSQITLISPDGLHPDNTTLFKKTLFALKNGESATVIHKYLYPEHNFVVLTEAYPTVSNFCLTFLIHSGFKEIYLLGVDLGYVDPDKHHGQNSSYYENNKTLYTVAKDESNVLHVEGNFLPYVQTKYEFNMARNVMEQALKKSKVDCYNTSNGAKITGAIPVFPDDIMVLTNASDKHKAMYQFEDTFVPLAHDFMEKYEQTFRPKQLSQSILTIRNQLPKEFAQLDEVEALVNTHDSVLREDAANLLVLTLLPSTIQCFFAALIKSSLVSDPALALKNANLVLSAYRELLYKATHLTKNVSERWDISVAFIERREKTLLKNKTLTIDVYDEKAYRFIENAALTQQTVVNQCSAEDISSDIIFVHNMAQMRSLSKILVSQLQADSPSYGLIVCCDIDVADAAFAICKKHQRLSVLFYDISDYLTIANEKNADYRDQLSLPLIEYIETTLHARYSQITDFVAMYHKPRFDMQPHIRKLTSDPTHPANWQRTATLLAAINNHHTKIIFKHFVAIPRTSAENGKNLDKGTILDCYGNRGMQINREVFPMEILDYCYIASNHHQFEECIEECLARV